MPPLQDGLGQGEPTLRVLPLSNAGVSANIIDRPPGHGEDTKVGVRGIERLGRKSRYEATNTGASHSRLAPKLGPMGVGVAGKSRGERGMGKEEEMKGSLGEGKPTGIALAGDDINGDGGGDVSEEGIQSMSWLHVKVDSLGGECLVLGRVVGIGSKEGVLEEAMKHTHLDIILFVGHVHGVSRNDQTDMGGTLMLLLKEEEIQTWPRQRRGVNEGWRGSVHINSARQPRLEDTNHQPARLRGHHEGTPRGAGCEDPRPRGSQS
jgi:hypothetical protein